MTVGKASWISDAAMNDAGMDMRATMEARHRDSLAATAGHVGLATVGEPEHEWYDTDDPAVAPFDFDLPIPPRPRWYLRSTWQTGNPLHAG